MDLNLQKDSYVARRHIIIWIEDDGTAIARDLGHANQFLLNGARVAEAVLHDGDVLTVGCTEIEFHTIG